ncbi:MAG: PQQ-binding-like beta-propeller repeat protein [Bryobacterales bacterium]|nr:PQQ-binding-like beta-propeller repeat protein [Acidobacteriota bacterium]MCB9383357.1 PQQ-binding-like beta-propeller repeat protein [Bryobacterales bacterium]
MRFVLLLGLVSLSAIAADWPQWRGPERTAISQETGLLQQWPEGGPKLLWQIHDLGEGYATPAVVGDRIYLLANQGMDDEYVQALSVSDGKVIWKTRIGKVGNPDQQPSYPMARSTPTIDGETLYALGSDGDLVAIQRATGEILWQKSLRSDFNGAPGKWAYAESPLIDGDTLIAAPGGPESTIVALEKDSGATIWKSAIPGGDVAAYASAIVVEAAGRKQYVEFLDKGVVGVDAETGAFLWRYDGTASGPANATTPIALDGKVYSGNSRRFGAGLVRLKPANGGVAAEQVYFSRNAPNTMGGQVLLGGVLYGTNNEGLTAADFDTGETLWQESEGGPGAILYADGMLYVHYESRAVALVEATPEAYRPRGSFTPPNPPAHPRGNREMAWAYPVVANGRLYIRDLGSLWCYDVAAE